MMGEEAEKIINMSLCKMAASRSFRVGGSSLHKHLLIASVLTKAQSAYFENWPAGSPAPTDSGSYDTKIEDGDEEDEDENVPVIDPRVFVQVESEIELPADILNCVEKLGSLGGVDFFHNNLSASVDDVEINEFSRKSNVGGGSGAERGEDSGNEVRVGGDLDLSEEPALSSEKFLRASMPNKASDKNFYGLPATSQDTSNYRSNFKRRRGSDGHLNESNENLTDSVTELAASNFAKRLRISNAANVIQEPVRKEVIEPEEEKQDRRVPPNPSSSGSDEENDQPDSMMEVDQITSLVQYFSFSQQQNDLKTPPANPSTGSRLGSSSNLMRSVSSPDLCNNHRCVVVTT